MSGESLLKSAREALTLPPRDRFVHLKAIGFQAVQEFQKSPELAIPDLLKYMDVIRMVKKIPSPPKNLNAILTKMTRTYLRLSGSEEPTIVLKKSSKINIDAGTIAVGDRSFQSESFDPLEKELLRRINLGECFFFDTGGDWLFNFQLRLVIGSEPVLSEKEYKCVIDSTPCVILQCPSGKLVIEDGFISTMDWGIETDIPPGNYKCQAYHLRLRGVFSFYIVLAKTEADAVNHETELPSLA